MMEYILPENASELEEIIVPEGVETLKHFQFGELKSLKRVLLPASLRSVQASTFPARAPWSSQNFDRIDVAPDSPWLTAVDGVLYSIEHPLRDRMIGGNIYEQRK